MKNIFHMYLPGEYTSIHVASMRENLPSGVEQAGLTLIVGNPKDRFYRVEPHMPLTDDLPLSLDNVRGVFQK